MFHIDAYIYFKQTNKQTIFEAISYFIEREGKVCWTMAGSQDANFLL